MKNKFMTKALAVVLSASMALSLSSATALTANGAAAPKLTKKSVSIEIGKKAKNKLAKASFKAGWRITKASVKKTAVAKAKVKKNKKVVVVTGVTAGSTKVVLKLKNAKTAATKTLKFTAKVKKAETPIEEPTTVAANFVSAKQTKNNEVEITLDKELEAVPSKEVLRVYLDGADYPLTEINFGADKKTLVVNFDFAASTEIKTYTYEFKTTDNSIGGSTTITTKSYDVAKIVAETSQEVPAGKLSTVKFTLQAASGIDVTGAGDNLSYTSVSFEGDEARAIPSSTNPQVLLSAVGDKTKMTITYTKDTTVEPVVVEVTAVAATATEAEAWSFSKDPKSAWLYSSKLESASVFVDGDTTINFWAKTADAASALGYSAVKYDEIEVTSSNEDILTVSDLRDGKYDAITVTGVKTGSANINIKCTEYVGDQELPATYTIPVTVKAKNNDLASFTTSTGSVSLTNAIDYDYGQWVNVFALNSNETDVDATFSVEVTDSKGKATTDVKAGTPNASTWKSYKSWDYGTWITAVGAARGTYSVKITAEGTTAGGQETITKSRTITVRVDDVLDAVSTDTGTYTKEITASEASLFVKDDDAKEVSNIGMSIKLGGKFAGYVRYDGSDWTVGSYDGTASGVRKHAVDVAASAKISTLNFYVQDKSQAYAHESANGVVYLGGEKVAAAKFYAVSDNEVPVRIGNKNLFSLSLYSEAPAVPTATNDVYFFGATSSKNEGIAAAGAYTVVAYDDYLRNGAELPKGSNQVGNKKSVSISYSITQPVVTYTNSESAEMFANPSTWLVLGDNIENLGFAWKAGKDDTAASSQKYAAAKSAMGDAFTVKAWLKGSQNGFSAGNRVFATSVPLTLNGKLLHYTNKVLTEQHTFNYVLENEKNITA